MDNQVCIVIPVYKPFNRLDNNELVSWQQCLVVLRNRPIYLACPSTLSIAGYSEYARQKDINCQVVSFAPDYFVSIDGYNRLMLSKEFYQRFEQHEYMLLYQLDAFVFRDELSQWCTRGYSYVGAPWFEGYLPADETTTLWQVGNGGFTLRRITDCLRVLNTFAIARPWPVVVKEHSPFGTPALTKLIYLVVRYLFFGNNTHWLVNDFYRYRLFHQEDYFWGVVCKEKFPWYKVPIPQEALAFSFEMAPSRMYSLNNQQLPMGCHAWEKHEPFFWKPFLEQAMAR